MESWRIDMDRGTEELEKSLSQCHFVYLRSNLDKPGREPEPPVRKAGV
jgi:hypothetical protein